VIQCRGLVERPHPQLAVEYADAGSVLLERSGAVPARGVDLDEPAVCRLVEWLERETAPCGGDRLGVVARRGQRIREPVEDAGDLAAEGVGGELLPVVERSRVA
jgi:hypothetical protein